MVFKFEIAVCSFYEIKSSFAYTFNLYDKITLFVFIILLFTESFYIVTY